MRLLIAVILSLILIGCGGNMTTVRIDSPGKVNVGQEVSIKVAVDSITKFDAANYDIDFDPAVFEVVAVGSGQIGSTVIPVDMWRDFGNGKLRIINNIAGLPGVSGGGYLAEVTLEVISYKANTRLDLSNGILGDNQANQIPATWLGKELTIVVVGDVNGDGLINATDITAVEKIILEMEAGNPLADVKEDGTVNCLDITAIKMVM